MASEEPIEDPILSIPTTPTHNLTPPSLPTSPSRESFNSSRPESSLSSVTSQSEQSSPITDPSAVPKSAPTQVSPDLAPRSSSSTLVGSPPSSSNSRSQTLQKEITPRSAPPGQKHHREPIPTHSSPPRERRSRLTGHWISDTISIVSLTASLIGLLFIGVRTYKLGVSSALNDAFSACASSIQAGLTTMDTSTPECKTIFDQGPSRAPYHLIRRVLGAARLPHLHDEYGEEACRDCFSIDNGIAGVGSFSGHFFLSIIAMTCVLGGLSLLRIRRRGRTHEVFTSPARFDYQITRHHQAGPETVTWQASSFVRHRPDEDQYPGHLRRSIQAGECGSDADDKSDWQPFNNSTDTLVNPWTGSNPSKVSIMNQSGDEKHEGLIELETTGDNKTFFDPDTGEFIHLTPWKSTQDALDHSIKGDDKGSVKLAIAKMFPGGMAWAGGKKVGEVVKSKTTSVELGIEDGMYHRLPPQAGDCVTGEMINEAPSGRPQLT